MRSERLEAPAAPAPLRRTRWRRYGASLVSLGVSGALLVGLYRSMDVRLIGEALLKADGIWLVISIGMILPITVLRAIRFFWVVPTGALPGIGEALRLTLVASAINIFVPAKAGDLTKSYFVATRSETSAGVAIGIVVFERLCDLFGLISWCLLGWLSGRPQVPGLPSYFWLLLGGLGGLCALLIFSERSAALLHALMTRLRSHRTIRGLNKVMESWQQMQQLLRPRRQRIVLLSVLLWLTHLFQIWMFTLALSAPIPFMVCASLSAVALMAGQLPFTFAGLGTRDVALVVLLSSYIGPESAAAMGILIATRGLIPALIGVPIMWPYVSSVVGQTRRRQPDVEQVE